MSDENGFLARWSQRKRQALEEARQAPADAPADAPVSGDPAPAIAEEPFDLSLLPDIEALTPATDISLFLRKGVPEALRNAALRRMWALDPAIRDYVGDALDYAWDWNTPGGVPGGGELGPGFDTAKMVAQIFGDGPVNENVTEDDAAQQIASGELSKGAEEASVGIAEPSETASQIGASAPEVVQGSTVAAPQKKRRHGGAAPAT